MQLTKRNLLFGARKVNGFVMIYGKKIDNNDNIIRNFSYYLSARIQKHSWRFCTVVISLDTTKYR